MAWYSLTDRSRDFPSLLAQLEQTNTSVTDASHLPEATTTRIIQLQRVPSSIKELDLSFFRHYEVFPANILIIFPRWQREQRGMQVGDTILQQAYLPPIRSLSVKMIMGSRILEIVDTDRQFSYTYVALRGHVERGTASWIAQLQDNELRFAVQTHSHPANPLARLVAPIFSLPYPAWITRVALENIARQFAQRNRGWVA